MDRKEADALIYLQAKSGGRPLSSKRWRSGPRGDAPQTRSECLDSSFEQPHSAWHCGGDKTQVTVSSIVELHITVTTWWVFLTSVCSGWLRYCGCSLASSALCSSRSSRTRKRGSSSAVTQRWSCRRRCSRDPVAAVMLQSGLWRLKDIRTGRISYLHLSFGVT